MKSKYGALAAIILCVILGFLPIPGIIKVVGIIIISITILYVNRSMYYFIKGNRIYMNKKIENKDKTWECYRKAYNANLIDKYKVTMASILIQKNDHNFGGQILDSVIEKSKDKKLVKLAKIQKSMVYQLNGEVEKSIEILEDVRHGGYCDKNLMINLGTYVLYQNDLKKAKELIKDTKKDENTSSGIADNHGWYWILTGQWKKAYTLYLDILDRKPRFPDPYVHAAQVFLHYNNIEKAVECLKEAVNKTWTNTIFFKQDILTQMINGLESENKEYIATCINESAQEVAKGNTYTLLDENVAKNIMNKPKEAEPVVEQPELDNTDTTTKEEDLETVDDELPNTELTEEDLKWEEEHK
jgi:tetratricopeptide (TPR) repeat protein